MKAFKIILTIFLALVCSGLVAQEKESRITGKITGENGKPVAGAFVSVPGKDNVKTNDTGEFSISVSDKNDRISVWADGYYRYSQLLKGRDKIVITLVPENKANYAEEVIMPYGTEKSPEKNTAATALTKKDFALGSLHVEDALTGKVAGLQIVGKSGMPGEGSYFNLRGIRSLVASNAPLIVIDGVPYIPDMNESPLLNGYSRGIFSNYNVNDYQNITVLKGAAAALYGSMGSNGVILIETDKAASDDLKTRISFNGQYGVNYKSKDLPLLGVANFKQYLSDIGMTHYENMSDLLTNFPFLQDDPEYYYKFLYNNNTDWQKEIFSPSFVTDNLLRVEGGDAIAKYDISVGYMGERGTLDETKSNRYHTQINTDVLISRKWEMFTTVGLAYTETQLQEQGMVPETNPMLAAYFKAPLLSPFQRNAENRNLVAYDTARYGISNPVAIVNSLHAKTKVYDATIRAGLNFRPNDYWTLTGVFSLYYNYNRESIFIPGVNSQTIVPLENGRANNTVRTGIAEALNMYYNIYASYNRTFGIHRLNAVAGGQVMTTRREYDAGKGFNTVNDYYQTLDKVTNTHNLAFFGYIDLWNWMNYYVHADYTFNDLLRADLNVSADASSSSGVDASRFGVFPSVGMTFMAKGLTPLLNSSWLNRLNVRAEYGLTGNSRFSSNYGKNYYESAMFQVMSGIRRANIPNTNLKWENDEQLNLGLDLTVWQHRIDVSADYYVVNSRDVVFGKPISSAFGTNNYFDNVARLQNRGIELSLQASVVKSRNFEWIIGGNIAFNDSEVKSLGEGVNEKVITLSDGSEVVTRVGERPYQFYGWEADGIFHTTAEAKAANLRNAWDNSFAAGDVRFKDQNDDHVIDSKDRVLLGSAQPKYHGAFYTSLQYKNVMLSANFTYSQGNKAYNAVRRSLESMSDFNNQSEAVLQRWQLEGQSTDMPRAVYGDPMQNSGFSSRWIEDASYLKLKNITLSYSFNKTFLKLFRSGTFYITGENLVTFTKYLGLDPEFAYSYEESRLGYDYAKVPLARTVKFGLNLKF